MIGLAATSYDPLGALCLSARTENPYDAKRRGSVTATLDGGVSVYDTGYSIADQVLRVKLRNPTKAILVSLNYLIAYYGQIIFCCESGAFLAVPTLAMSGAIATLSLRLVSRLD